MKCYAPDGTEYKHGQWESCIFRWYQHPIEVSFSLAIKGWEMDCPIYAWECALGVPLVSKRYANARGPTIRAAFCNATTAWHEAQVKP